MGGRDSEQGKTRDGHLKQLFKLRWFEDELRNIEAFYKLKCSVQFLKNALLLTDVLFHSEFRDKRL